MTALGRLSPLPEADIGGTFQLAELTLIQGDVVRKQLAIVRMWNAENVHFDARWRELFGVIQDGQTRTWNDKTRFGLNRKIQNGLVMMVRGALVLDSCVPIGRFELTENNAHRGISVSERRVAHQNQSAIN